MASIFLSCLIALAGTSSTMLNKSNEVQHYRLVFYLKGKEFNISPFRMILAVVIRRQLFTNWEGSFLFVVFWELLIMNTSWIKLTVSSLWYSDVYFFLCYVKDINYIAWFFKLLNQMTSCNKSYFFTSLRLHFTSQYFCKYLLCLH